MISTMNSNLEIKTVENNFQPKTVAEMTEHISKNCHFTSQQTHALIKQKLESDNSEIQTVEESYRISLICPLTRKRLAKPARGINCTHLECYDLATYIELGFNSFKWTCPVCQKYAPSIELKLDIFLMNIINECNFENIEILKDYTWRNSIKSKDESKNNTEINLYDLTTNYNETIILDDDSSDNSESDDDDDDDDDDAIFMTQISGELKSLSFKNDETLSPEQVEPVTSTLLEKVPSPIIQVEVNIPKSKNVGDTECPTCKRKFKGIRGLNCHLSSKFTTCEIGI